jgi:membrane peptidoglycan carboxypeptidase
LFWSQCWQALSGSIARSAGAEPPTKSPSVEGKNAIITIAAARRRSSLAMKKFFFAGIGIVSFCILVLAVWIVLVFTDLPDISVLKHYRPSAAAEVLDKDGNVLTQFFDRKFRIWVPIASLPDIVIHAVTTAEDDTFFEHEGVNYKATWDALVHDMQKRRFARGGSTITQQMIKNVLLSREKTLTRKLREYILARKAEEILTKRQILQIYLNEVEWGENIYGIEAASRFYFDKHAAELSPAQAALLAGMLPNPRYYNPYKRPDKARDRQERVLGNMLQAKLINADEYATGAQGPFGLRSEGGGRFYSPALQTANNRPCYQSALEQILKNLFDDQRLYRKGLTIRTSLDKNLQEEMNIMEERIVSRDDASAPGRIIIVKQAERIRAVSCSMGKESSIRELLASRGLLESGYDVEIVSADDVARDQIILAVDGEQK